ncbi:hypothetical protein ILYODFUR_015497 [Ilyodon furcidens]|uniref:Uncharacterized protein n=1 Tax=Ilyodon furcidens TaxID=33524 RepID=A0ABV0V640_9TELE
MDMQQDFSVFNVTLNFFLAACKGMQHNKNERNLKRFLCMKLRRSEANLIPLKGGSLKCWYKIVLICSGRFYGRPLACSPCSDFKIKLQNNSSDLGKKHEMFKI